MLELRVSGDTHPKTFTLVTDDGDGELDRLQEIIHGEIEAAPDDPMRQLLDNHSSDQFAEGVEIPSDQIGEWEMVLENDWPTAANVIDEQRADAARQIEEQAAQTE